MDDVSILNFEKLKQKFKDCYTKISMISGGLTRHHQSLDVPIDNPLKDELKKNVLRIELNKNKTAHKFLKKDLIN